jgi:3',5'-cyclic-AMP phosphodiesterase
MPTPARNSRQHPQSQLTRRQLLRATLGATAMMSAPSLANRGERNPAGGRDDKVFRIGLITDLHQDIMHDAPQRMSAFLKWAKNTRAGAVMQLGDFAYPKVENAAVIDPFNAAGGLHVIGNHDLDAGHTKKQCLEIWGMPARYYSKDVGGIRVVVLDANESGSPTHGGGYVKYVGAEQMKWLEQELTDHAGPFLIASHQPLAGSQCVDNSSEIQSLLGRFAEKIWICINGHSHLDLLRRVQGVSYLHINSASYQWVGGSHLHNSYTSDVHESHKWIQYTCPYRDPVFTALVLDPADGSIIVEGCSGQWVGPSPAALGADTDDSIHHGEEIVPWIRNRRIERAAGTAAWLST